MLADSTGVKYVSAESFFRGYRGSVIIYHIQESKQGIDVSEGSGARKDWQRVR